MSVSLQDWLNRLSVYSCRKEILNFAAYVPVHSTPRYSCRSFPSFFGRFIKFGTLCADIASTVELMEAVSLFRASCAVPHKARVLSHNYKASRRHLNF